MPIAPPPEATLDHPPMGLMDLLGRMRSLTDQAGFTGTLPAIWQCSDESQMIKKPCLAMSSTAHRSISAGWGAARSDPLADGGSPRPGYRHSWRQPPRRQ